ncbi:MAG TPA: hypothetical protein DEF45_13755 [Rhodopirellula sp.]|nr:MAG: hypothetical protein CBD74_06445 [Saprospirales bacterium TMED214]HBV64074.1 hypothetical protein [Rhodopirellula sp.]
MQMDLENSTQRSSKFKTIGIDVLATGQNAQEVNLTDWNSCIHAGILSARRRVSEATFTLICKFGDNFRARKGELRLHKKDITEQIHPPAIRTLRVYCLPR